MGFSRNPPCGPISFRTLLESRWAAKNSEPRSILIGETVDAWVAAEGEKPRHCAPLFKTLAELRKREKQDGQKSSEADEPIHVLTAEEIPA